MITYKVIIEKEKIKSMVCEGHAEQNEYGKDIVCASCSTALIMSINLLEKFTELQNITYVVKNGYFNIEVINSNDVICNILDNLVYTLNELELQYPKYIKKI